jgi:hypothetical protein
MPPGCVVSADLRMLRIDVFRTTAIHGAGM